MNYEINTKRVLSFLLVTAMVLSTGVIADSVGDGFPLVQSEVDLTIFDQDITSSDGSPSEGDPVTITAVVHGDQSTGSGAWEKSGVVVDIGGTGEADRTMAPSVLKLSNGTYVMFYTGRPSATGYSYRIFRAISDNGIVWQKQGMVMDFGGPYETYGVYCPNVVIGDNGTYHMWYAGLAYSGGYRAYILKATSFDEGFTWQKEGLDLNYGSSADPDGVTGPSVLFDGTQWHMWYGGIDWGSPNEVRICHAHKATLSDPWIKDGVVLNNDGPYDNPSASYPNVISTGAGYEMFYTGYSPYSGPYRVLHATSPDGLSWTRTGIAIEATLPLEGNQVGFASAMLEGVTYKAWYSGYDGTNWRIFYADKSPVEPGLDATCTVSFYLDSIAEANLIDRQFNVFVPGDGETTVSMDWIAETGNHTIIVEVSDVDPPDSDLTNNIASTHVFVEESSQVDLSIYDEDITVSNGNPTEGDSINIQAVVHGDETVESVWQKHGVVVDIGGAGEDRHVYTPSVLQLQNGTYVMYYSANGNGGSPYDITINRAFSFDGIVWHKEGMVLDKGGSYEEVGVWNPYVLIDDNGIFQMWYTGVGYNNGYRFYIHRASSSDGLIWQKHGLELTYGSQVDPDGVRAPFVIFDGNEWHMWYDGVDWTPTQEKICHAHKSLLSDPWIKDGVVLNNDGPYDAPIAGYPWVLPTGNGYEMYYTGANFQGTQRLLHATSPDGYSWTKTGIVLEASLPYEGDKIGNPSVLNINGEYKVWYGGFDDTNIRIFYAEKAPVEPGLDATCTVSFYLDSIAEANLIDRQFNVFVPGDGQTTVTTDWIAEAGNHNIIVEVSDVDPPDSDLSNNVASKGIFVENPATATATGPQGAHHDPIITLTYEWTGTPSEVDLYYSLNTGDSWNYLGTDTTVDGSFDWTPEANPGPKPSKYYWIANAKNGADDVGIPADGTPPEAGPFNWKTWDVCTNAPRPLSGNGDNWHFISIPLDITGDILSVFDDANWGDGGTTWDYIQWYDSNDPSDPWKSYSIYRPSILNDVVTVDKTMGFWIHLTSNDGDGVLTVGEGTEISSTIIQLNAGWNLVGYPTLNETTIVADALWGTGADVIEAFDPTAPYKLKAVGPTYIMMPGEAYWIHVPADTTWTIDW